MAHESSLVVTYGTACLTHHELSYNVLCINWTLEHLSALTPDELASYPLLYCTYERSYCGCSHRRIKICRHSLIKPARLDVNCLTAAAAIDVSPDIYAAA